MTCVYLIFSAGSLSEDEVETIKGIILSPSAVDIPDWFLNRKKDRKEGKTMHLTVNNLDSILRDDVERMKKIRFVFRFLLSLYSCLVL